MSIYESFAVQPRRREEERRIERLRRREEATEAAFRAASYAMNVVYMVLNIFMVGDALGIPPEQLFRELARIIIRIPPWLRELLRPVRVFSIWSIVFLQYYEMYMTRKLVLETDRLVPPRRYVLRIASIKAILYLLAAIGGGGALAYMYLFMAAMCFLAVFWAMTPEYPEKG